MPEDPLRPSAAGELLLLEARQAIDTGQWRKARRTLKKYLNGTPKSPEGWTLLGRTYMATGSNGKARRRFDKALTFEPHYAPAFVGRGELFERKGRWDEAANDFRAAMLSDPTNPEAQQGLTRVTSVDPTMVSGDSDDRGVPTGPKAPSAVSGDSDDRGRPTGPKAPSAE